MKLEQIVTNLELSKKLKEAGIEQEGGLFYWVCWSSECGGNGNYFIVDELNYIKSMDCYVFPIRAFIVNELLEILPETVVHSNNKYFFEMERDGLDSFDAYYSDYDDFIYPLLKNKMNTFQDALGRLVLKLKKDEVL